MTQYVPNPPSAQQFAPPPGWYADPGGTPAERWWTGAQWTEHTRRAGGEDDSLGLLVPKGSTYATRALVWGIISVAVPFAFLPSALAIVFGAFAIPREAALEKQGHPSKRTRAIVGLSLGILGLALMVGFGVFFAMLPHRPPACNC